MSDNRQITDIELLNRISSGDKLAMDELIIRYRPTVEYIAKKYVSNLLETDDLMQEGMIGLLAAIKSYNIDKGAKFVTYASRCINNSIQNALGKLSRMKDIPPSSIVVLDDEYIDGQQVLSAEDEFLAKESVHYLADVIYEELSTFETEVLKLHIVGDSYNEIAKKLGKNPKAIDNAIQRIRKKLNGVAF